MRFSRRVNLCILVSLVLITILYRYPLGIEHELGSDTTFIHTMANSISQDGYANWILHPTSIFGLYALSYPSAEPFILSSGFQVASVPVEGGILLLGMLLAIAGVISAYVVAKLLRDDDTFAHSVAFLFTHAPFYIKDTAWVASTRGFVVAMLPFFFLLLLKHIKTKDVRYLILSFAVFIVMGSMHRMGLLAGLVYIAYVLAIPLHMVTQRLRFSLLKFEKPMRLTVVTLALFAFLAIFYIQFQFPGISGANVVEQYESGSLMSGNSFPILLLNMAVSFVGRVGLLLPFAFVGLIAYVWKRPKESSDKFLLLTAFVFLPLLSLRDYMVEFVIPIFVVMAVYGVISVASIPRNRRQIGAMLLAGLLVASAVFAWTTKDHWRNVYTTDKPIPNPAYDIALYVRNRVWGTVAANAGLTAGRIAAISEMPTLPLGGASTHFNSAQQLMWGFVSGKNLQVRLLDLTKVSFDTDEIYVPEGVRNAELDWEVVLGYREPVAAQQNMDFYNVHFIVTENAVFPYYTSYGYTRTSCLLGDDGLPLGDPHKICIDARNVLPDNDYLVFTNSFAGVWMARGGS